MFDLKKSFGFPYIQIKFFWIFILLALFAMISETTFLIAAVLIPVIGVGLYGTKLVDKLKVYNGKTWKSICKFSGVLVVSSIIFGIMELILVLIGAIPLIILGSKAVDGINALTLIAMPYELLTTGVIVGIVILAVFVILAIILAILMHIGLMRYFKSEKFEVFFEFKKNLKILFSGDALVAILFMLGYSIMYLLFAVIVFLILSGLLSLVAVSIDIFVFVYLLFMVIMLGAGCYIWFETIKGMNIKK